jgi:cytochrome c oxidase subunit II
MHRRRRSSLLVLSLLGLLSAAGGNARADPLTPGQGATQQLFLLVLIPAVGIGVLVMALVAYAILKFRVRPGHTQGPAVAKTHDRKLESLWTVIPALILLVVGVAAFQTLVVTDTIPPNPDLTVCVFGRQWAWGFSVANATGVCPTEPPSSLDGNLNVRVGQVVKLVFQSIDVAHSFSIPAYNLKIDVIPGHQNLYWFKALAAGEFEVHCAEFCGLQHYAMVAKVHVIPA